MKSMRFLYVLLLIPVVILLQSCGGGGTSDTAGSLTIGTPTSTSNNDGTYTVSATVTYTPPSGKSAQGVVIRTTATDSFVDSSTDDATLTSGSNSVTYTFLVRQYTTSNRVSIVASIGGMTASVGVTIPAYVPPVVALSISAATADFLSTDAAGTFKTIVISGGVTPYSVSSSVPADIKSEIYGFVNNARITLINAAVLPGTPATATVTVTDSAAATKTIAVTYFK